MNRNTALFIGVAAFVLLFYKQEVAINLSIFCLLVWGMLFFTIGKAQRGRTFWWLSAAVWIGAAGFAWYGDFVCFAALFVSMNLLAFKVFKPEWNVLLSPFAAIFNYVTSPFRMLRVDKWLAVNANFRKGVWKKLFAYFIIPMVLIIPFLIIYIVGSSTFSSFFKFDINVNILQVIFLTMLGFFFLFNFFHFYVPEISRQINPKLSDEFTASRIDTLQPSVSFFDLKFERRSGEVSLIILNVLLLIFIITYNIEHVNNVRSQQFPLPEELYARVYALIFSIILAIAIILIYFKNTFNFDPQAAWLKRLSYIWIFLNAALIVSVAVTNKEYIYYSGLTFKRVGIYIFLLLCATGLLCTFCKVKYRKTNAFLFNRMFWAVFVTLVIGSIINWSWIVTKYNAHYVKQADWGYTYQLDYNKELLHQLQTPKTPDDILQKADSLVKRKRSEPFLSRNLYYQFLNLK